MSFINESPRPQLHPDASWVLVNDDKLQLRLPNNNFTTFPEHGKYIAKVLEYFRGDDVPVEELDEDLYHALVDMIIYQGGFADEMLSDNQLTRLLQQHIRCSFGVYHKDTPPTKVKVIGEGNLATVIRKVMDEADEFTTSDGTDRDTLAIVLSDTDDIQYFLSVNEELVKNKQPAFFMYWASNEFNSMFVVPGETPCFACAFQKEAASSEFLEVLQPHTQLASGDVSAYQGGLGMDQLASSIVIREVLSILTRSYDVARPGMQSVFDPVAMHIENTPVLKLPRCKVCSPVNNLAVRAIRDVIEPM